VHYTPRQNEPAQSDENKENDDEDDASTSDEEPSSFSSLQVETGLDSLRLSLFRRRRTSFPPKHSPASSKSNDIVDAHTPKLVGFPNLGNTCYLNAVVQALSHCDELRRYFSSPHYKEEGSGMLLRRTVAVPQPTQGAAAAASEAPAESLVSAFASLLEAQEKTDANVVHSAVRHLLQCFLAKAPQFRGMRQMDAEEFLVAFLDSLHVALNRIGRRPTYVELDPPKTLAQEQLAALYWDNYQRGNDSIFKDIFAGQIMSRSACLECGANSTSFDAFWELSVTYTTPLGTGDSIKAMLENYFTVERVPYYCSRCANEQEGRRQLTVTRWPSVLVVHVKRFAKDAASEEDVWVKRDDDVQAQLVVEGDATSLYRLFAVVEHFGSVEGGHYTCDVLFSEAESRWVNCDDDKMTEVAEATVANGRDGYIFFYKAMRR